MIITLFFKIQLIDFQLDVCTKNDRLCCMVKSRKIYYIYMQQDFIIYVSVRLIELKKTIFTVDKTKNIIRCPKQLNLEHFQVFTRHQY